MSINKVDSQQQKQEIYGLIIDVDYLPIIGTIIMKKGTSNGTVSDIDGNLVLNVDKMQFHQFHISDI